LGASLPSIRFVRFAKLWVLIADVLTIFCAVLTVGLQINSWRRDGSWPALSLSLVLGRAEHGRDDIFTTASIAKFEESRVANFVDALLQMPIIMLLLAAAVLLTAFYSWLLSLERNTLKRKFNEF
jgi:hypothetical protein